MCGHNLSFTNTYNEKVAKKWKEDVLDSILDTEAANCIDKLNVSANVNTSPISLSSLVSYLD